MSWPMMQPRSPWRKFRSVMCSQSTRNTTSLLYLTSTLTHRRQTGIRLLQTDVQTQISAERSGTEKTSSSRTESWCRLNLSHPEVKVCWTAAVLKSWGTCFARQFSLSKEVAQRLLLVRWHQESPCNVVNNSKFLTSKLRAFKSRSRRLCKIEDNQ